MKSFIKVIDPGFYTSIQDKGRYGYRHIGFPVSGAMDFYSFERSNLLVGNIENEAGLECTIKGPSLLFSGPSWVAISGANAKILLNEKKVNIDKPFFCDLGDLLKLGNIYNGQRCYISFGGGISTERIYGSRSQYYPLTVNSKILKSDKIPIKGKLKIEKVKLKLVSSVKYNCSIDVFKGPDWNMIDNDIQKKIINSSFEIGSNNRMAYRISGSGLHNKLSISSSSVLPGTVQITPDGDLIIVMRDGQITGGYPRILQLTDKAQYKLAQCYSGQLINFQINESCKLL